MDTPPVATEAVDLEVPVVLYEPRTFTIGYYTKRSHQELEALAKAQAHTGNVAPVALPTEKCKILPGLNWVKKSILDATQLLKRRRSVNVQAVDILRADPMIKRQVLEMTTSRRHLARWAALDASFRSEITTALAKRAQDQRAGEDG